MKKTETGLYLYKVAFANHNHRIGCRIRFGFLFFRAHEI